MPSTRACACLLLASLQSSAVVAADEAGAVVLLQRRAELVEREAAAWHFSKGKNGTSDCPSGFRSIVNEHACKQGNAALKVGPWRHKGSWPLLPSGCFVDAAGDVYLNSNSSGTGKEGHVPICEADSNFAAGSEGKTNCPPGFRNIISEHSCREAKNVLNLGLWKRKDSWPNMPGGCFTDPAGDLFLNSNASGAGKPGHAPVCEKAIAQRSDTPTMYTVEAITLPDLPGDIKEGDFAVGTNGTDACPPGYKVVDKEGPCRQAKNALNLDGVWRRKDNFYLKPFGCSTDSAGDLYLNSNQSAVASDGNAPVCQKATDGEAAEALAPAATVAEAPASDVYGAPVATPATSSTAPEASVTAPEAVASDGASLDDMEAEIVQSHNAAAVITGQLGGGTNAYENAEPLSASTGVGYSGQPAASNDAFGFPGQLDVVNDASSYPGQVDVSSNAVGLPGQVGASIDALGYAGQSGVNTGAVGFPGQLGATNDALGSMGGGLGNDPLASMGLGAGNDALSSPGLGAGADAFGFPGQLGASSDALGSMGIDAAASTDTAIPMAMENDEDSIENRERDIVAAAGADASALEGDETDEDGLAPTGDDDDDKFEMLNTAGNHDALDDSSIASVPVLPGAMEDRELAIIAEQEVPDATAVGATPSVATSERRFTNSGANWQP